VLGGYIALAEASFRSRPLSVVSGGRRGEPPGPRKAPVRPGKEQASPAACSRLIFPLRRGGGESFHFLWIAVLDLFSIAPLLLGHAVGLRSADAT